MSNFFYCIPGNVDAFNSSFPGLFQNQKLHKLNKISLNKNNVQFVQLNFINLIAGMSLNATFFDLTPGIFF